MRFTLTLLAVAGVGSAFVSDWFVNALAPAIVELNISQAFAGLVIVAIAGNAVENTAGLVLACEGPLRPRDLGRQELGRADRGVPVPAARADLLRAVDDAHVRAGARLHRRAALTALALSQVTGDGEAAAFEGWALSPCT